jgi:hypothetical protein
MADVGQLYSHVMSRGNPEKVQVCAWENLFVRTGVRAFGILISAKRSGVVDLGALQAV